MEEWRQISDFPNYEISNLGNVRNRKRQKQLSPFTSDGYNQIILWSNGIRKHHRISRLVARMFLENYDDTLEVKHLNGKKCDDTVTNLQWMQHVDICHRVKKPTKPIITFQSS